MQVTELFTAQLEDAIRKNPHGNLADFLPDIHNSIPKYRKIFFTSVQAAGALCTRWSNIHSAMLMDICYYIPAQGMVLLKSPATAAI